MKIRTVLPALLLAALLAACMTAAAEPLVPDSDLTGTFTILYDEDDPSAGAFTFSYRYPHIDESLPDAYVVNSFYQSRIEEQETNVVFMADGFADAGIPVTMSCSYRITCSNDDFFSVLVQQEQTSGDFHDTVWQGNTFSRKNGTVDSACDLPRLLGILDAEEQDEYLVERQTGKAVADLPIDIKKYLVSTAVIAAIIFVLLNMFAILL